MFWSQRFRSYLGASAILLGAAVATVAPTLAAIVAYGPDLTVTMSQSSGRVQAGSQLTYTLTLKNVDLIEGGCDLDRHGHPICTPDTLEPGPISGVDLQDYLPAGATLVATSNTAGFTCWQDTSGVVNCNNGSLPDSGIGTITLTINTPSLNVSSSATLTNCATVNPLQTLDERDYSNNSACTSAIEINPSITPTPLPPHS
jgi:hypothetical protein